MLNCGLYVIKTAMEHPVCHEARSLTLCSNASISTSYAKSRSIDARLFATRETTVNALLYRFFSERKGLSALNRTDFANFEDRFWSWTCVHLSLTCVRVRKKCSVGKTLVELLSWRKCHANTLELIQSGHRLDAHPRHCIWWWVYPVPHQT